jgi:hypothetical protein
LDNSDLGGARKVIGKYVGQTWQRMAKWIDDPSRAARRSVATSMGLVSTALDRSSSNVLIGGVIGSKRCMKEEDLKNAKLLDSIKRLVALERM